MAQIESVMFPLNVVLSFAGCNIFPFRMSWVNFVVRLHTLFLLITHGYYIYFIFTQTEEIFLSLLIVVVLLIGIPLILVIYYKKKSLQRLLITIIRQLPDSEIMRLKRLTILFSFLAPLTFTIKVMEFTPFLRDESFSSKLQILQSLYSQLNTPAISGCSLMLFCLIAIQSYSIHKISVLRSSIEQKTPYEVVLSIKSTIDKKKRLMQFFSFLPISWFVLTVFTAFYLAYVTMYIKNEPIVSDTVGLIFMLLLLFIVMDTTDRCQKKCNLQFEKLSILIMKVHGNSIHEWIPVLKSIEAAQNFKWIAWDLFPLHREIITPFIGSFISFSAMFIQILPFLRNNKKN